MNTKLHPFKKLTAVLLAVVILVSTIPTGVLAVAAGYTPGDVNGDGRVNAMDVSLVR